MDRPNILLFMCDQMRSFELGCYGSTFVQTPNLDHLAATGTRFATAVTNNPLCTPARSITLSGQYSRTCAGMLGNVHDNPPNPARVRLRDQTLPEVLKAAGYETVLIGKWHIDPRPGLVGFNRAIYPDFEHAYYGQRYWSERGASWTVEQFAPEYELAQLRQFLDEPRDAPFFVFYNIGQPHQPIGPGHMPERYCRLYDPAKVPLRPNVPGELERDHARHWFNVYTSAGYFWRHLAKTEQDPADLVDDGYTIRDLAAHYCGAVTLVDDYVGRALDVLSERGLAENTIVVFVSDHGDNLGSHGKFNKGALIEESISIPLLFRDPRHPGGVVVDGGVASLVDVMPTLLALADVACPDCVQGGSLAAAVRGDGSTSLPNGAYIETRGAVGVRTLTHLLGMAYDEETCTLASEPHLFFDLSRDPYELQNLASTGAQQGLRHTLGRGLRAWDADTPWLDAPPTHSVREYLVKSRWMGEAKA